MGTSIEYDDLSPQEHRRVCDGCGTKGGWFRPPQWIFEGDCNRHDFAYWKGCTRRDRWRADLVFLRGMLSDAREYGCGRMLWYSLMAVVYFLAVRLCGSRYFFYGTHQRTADELARKSLQLEEKRLVRVTK